MYSSHSAFHTYNTAFVNNLQILVMFSTIIFLTLRGKNTSILHLLPIVLVIIGNNGH